MAASDPQTAGRPRVGPKRSTPRDAVVDVFLSQQGHVSADDLFDAVRKRHPRVGRATVYRTLQRLVDAGLASKVDFGDGRLRYEASRGRPHHAHFICSSCHRSSEFLSSDVEGALEEVSQARRFAPSHTIVQIHGTCEECRTGRKTPLIDGDEMRWLFARDALRIAIETERQGVGFYTRAARVTTDRDGRRVFRELAGQERQHLAALRRRYRALIAQDPDLESRPTFLFFKAAASGLFAAGADELRRGADDEQALQIGIRCERGSHRFFKRYGERFDDSEGRRIFLEFAEEERAHLALLIRELRALRARRGRPTRRRA